MLTGTFVLGFALMALGLWRWLRPRKQQFDEGPALFVFMGGGLLWALALYFWCR